MKAAFYQVQGSTRDVLEVGEVAEPVPGRGQCEDALSSWG